MAEHEENLEAQPIEDGKSKEGLFNVKNIVIGGVGIGLAVSLVLLFVCQGMIFGKGTGTGTVTGASTSDPSGSSTTSLGDSLSSKILFSRSKHQSVSILQEVWSLNPNGTGLTKLTELLMTYYINPSFSFDGKNMVFTDSKCIFTRTVIGDSHELKVILEEDTDKNFDISDPSFSPDGKMVVFIANEASISTVDLDGQNLKELTKDGDKYSRVRQPVYTPDGKHIVALVTFSPNDWNTRIGLFDSVTGVLEKTLFFKKSVHSFCISPKGDKIAAFSEESLSTMDIDGNGQEEEELLFEYDSDFMNSPSWSPDGKTIIFNDASEELMEVNVETKQSRWLKDENTENIYGLRPFWISEKKRD